MWAEKRDLEIYEQRRANGTLTIRVYAMIDSLAHDALPTDPKIATEDGLIINRGVKFFGDGAMGSWSAAMMEPYADRPNVSGTLCYSQEALVNNLTLWARHGWQLATHAIGDAANKQILDAYEELQKRGIGAGEDTRWRVEHAQILAAADIPRFRALGVIPSMQPSHCAADLLYAEARLGHDRASRSYAWHSLFKTGVEVMPFGSDFPTAGSVPPVLGLHAAVTRQNVQGVPTGGFFPEQRITREQAIKGYTVDAAYASFREKELGRIAPGFFADLTIFDRDVVTVDADRILDAIVLGTVVGGRVVYAMPHDAAKADQTLAGVARSLGLLVPSHLHRPESARVHDAIDTVPADPLLLRWIREPGWRRYVRDAAEDRHSWEASPHKAAPAEDVLVQV